MLIVYTLHTPVWLINGSISIYYSMYANERVFVDSLFVSRVNRMELKLEFIFVIVHCFITMYKIFQTCNEFLKMYLTYKRYVERKESLISGMCWHKIRGSWRMEYKLQLSYRKQHYTTPSLYLIKFIPLQRAFVVFFHFCRVSYFRQVSLWRCEYLTILL